MRHENEIDFVNKLRHKIVNKLRHKIVNNLKHEIENNLKHEIQNNLSHELSFWFLRHKYENNLKINLVMDLKIIWKLFCDWNRFWIRLFEIDLKIWNRFEIDLK